MEKYYNSMDKYSGALLRLELQEHVFNISQIQRTVALAFRA